MVAPGSWNKCEVPDDRWESRMLPLTGPHRHSRAGAIEACAHVSPGVATLGRCCSGTGYTNVTCGPTSVDSSGPQYYGSSWIVANENYLLFRSKKQIARKSGQVTKTQSFELSANSCQIRPNRRGIEGEFTFNRLEL